MLPPSSRLAKFRVSDLGFGFYGFRGFRLRNWGARSGLGFRCWVGQETGGDNQKDLRYVLTAYS